MSGSILAGVSTPAALSGPPLDWGSQGLRNLPIIYRATDLSSNVAFWPRVCENSGVENETCMRLLWSVIFPAIIPNN